MTFLTVLMPAFNAERTLAAAIYSIQVQTMGDFRLLVLDDGSTDRTPDIAADIARTDTRVQLFRSEQNQGIIATANRGLDLAETRWVARMDADDICSPERFARQAAFQAALPHLVAFGAQGTMFGNQTGPIRYPVGEAAVQARLPFDTPLLNPASCMDLRFLNAHQLRYRESAIYAEDYDMWAQLSLHGGRLSNMADDLHGYYIHNQSISQSKREQQELTACRIRYGLLEAQGVRFDAEERQVLERQQFLPMAAVTPAVITALRGIAAKVQHIPALEAVSGAQRNYEAARFVVSALPRPSSLASKARLALLLGQVSPLLAAVFLAMYPRQR